MPTYDYLIPDTGDTLTVSHSIAKSPSTWGELCEVARLDLGATSPETPVKRLQSGGYIVTGKPMESQGGCCGGGACRGGHGH